ncbi:hypothetical protein RSAG8_11800, partial [Rhizoctonia solani AG-8 WAC10335]
MTSASQYKSFDLIEAIHLQTENARYMAISGIALLIYDWLSTLDKEVEYTWSRRWTLARAVYHLNRILPVSLIRWVLWLLIPGLIVTVGHAILQVTINIDRTTVLTNPFPEYLQGCLVSIPNNIWLAYLSGVLYELVIFCLIVRRIWQLGDGLGLTPLMRQLLKNGATFFAVNLGLMLFSCVGSAYPSTIIMANGSGLLAALSSIMCSRIFFSMHEFASEDRTHISLGLRLTNGVRGSAIISGQFAIPMQTFSDGSRPPSVLQVAFDTPPQSLGRSASTQGKETLRGCDNLFV